MKNLYKSKLIIFAMAIVVILGVQKVFAAQVDIKVTQEKREPAKVVITSEKEMKEVKIYRKSANEKFILIYKAKANNTKKFECKIPTRYFSTEENKEFKVVVIDKDGQIISNNYTIEAIPSQVPMNPEETAKPTSTSSPIPTKPTSNPTTSATTSPSQSQNPTTQPSPSSSNSEQPTTNEGISLDRTKLMIDNCHYNVAELVATTQNNTKVTWESSNPKIAAVNQKGVVKGLTYGKVTITASTVDASGKTHKAECETKVITKVTEKPSNVKYQAYNKKTGGATYYLIHGTMGKDFVEAYINNAADLIKKYPDNKNWKKEASKLTIHTYRQKNVKITYDDKKKTIKNVSGAKYPQSSSFHPSSNSNFEYKTLTKPAGEMSPTNYIFFFCHQNQWEYLLKKNSSTGKWECICEKESSAGYCRNEFNDYLAIFFNGPYKLCYTYRYYSKGASTSQNLVHWDTGRRTGVPTSGGCIHLGKYTDEIYYRLVKEAGVGTRFILF